MKEILNNIIYMAKRFKLASTFNLIGLTLAFVAFYLFMTQVEYQVSYNHGIEDYQQLYRMESDYLFNEWEYSDNMCRPFVLPLDSMPEVESYSLWMNTTSIGNEDFYKLPFKKGNRIIRYLTTRGNNTVVSTLTSKVVSGTIEWTDDDHEGMIISSSIARDYFGRTDVAGDSMLYVFEDETGAQQTFPLLVRGVFEDFPANSELENQIYLNVGNEDLHSTNFLFKCIVKFKDYPGDDNESFIQRLKQDIKDMMTEAYKSSDQGDEIPEFTRSVEQTKIRFIPLKSSYFKSTSFTSTKMRGFIVMIIIMITAAILTVILATINFLNFTLAESPMRIRSLNTRLVLGANRNALRRGLVVECVVIAVVTCLLALLLCQLLHSTLGLSMFVESGLALCDHLPLALGMLALSVVVGIAAGTYPAVFATSFAPAMALKGSYGLTPRGKRLRSTLLCVQLTISLMMIIYMASLYLQSNYIFNSPYGYDKERILGANLPYTMAKEEKAQLVKALEALPEVSKATFSNSPIGGKDAHNVLRTESGDEMVRYGYMLVEPGYMTTMGIKMIEGHDFTPDDVNTVIVNKASRKRWPWLRIGTKVSTGIDDNRNDSCVVIGVCDDIRYGTTRIDNDKPFFFIHSGNDEFLGFLNVHITQGANLKQAQEQVNSLIHDYCGQEDLKATEFDDSLIDVYRNEFRYINLIFVITIMSLLITIIGVICLSLFEAEYRRKEIGIRKVAGATTGEIIGMFVIYYVRLILLSFAIAAIPAWVISESTLRYFPEHTTIHWWIFPLSLLLVGGITLGIVLALSMRTARENPTASLKT